MSDKSKKTGRSTPGADTEAVLKRVGTEWNRYKGKSPADLDVIRKVLNVRIDTLDEQALELYEKQKGGESLTAEEEQQLRNANSHAAIDRARIVAITLLLFHHVDADGPIPDFQDLDKEKLSEMADLSGADQLAGYRAPEHLETARQIVDNHPEITTIEEFKEIADRMLYPGYGEAIVRTLRRAYKKKYGSGWTGGWSGFRAAVLNDLP